MRRKDKFKLALRIIWHLIWIGPLYLSLALFCLMVMMVKGPREAGETFNWNA